MENLVPLGTGNSRFMKSNISPSTTLDQLIQMLNNGTFPYDVGTINPAGISQQGTPLNKDTLLKDATAALYGLESDAVPDDVLNLLSRFQRGLGNEYLWGKYGVSYSEIRGETINNQANSWTGETYQYSSSISIENGVISLANPTTTTIKPVSSGGMTEAAGKYFICSAITGSSNVFFCTNSWGSGTTVYVSYQPISTEKTFGDLVGYVNSPDADAYPPTQDDGYMYAPFGKLGGFCKMATGSYVGTGTYGASNPNTLTFDFPPKLVIISRSDSPDIMNIWYYGSAAGIYPYNSNYYNNFSLSGTTLSWYSPNQEAAEQLNFSGKTYKWIALG